MRKRILLDTNVWRYLSDADAYTQLLVASHKADIQVTVAPAAVYETLAMANHAVRDRVVALMARPRWQRLMPEAYSECEEIRAEITRLHPQWLRPEPDLWLWNKHRRDWTRQKHGFWDRLTKQTTTVAEAARFPYATEARLQSKDRGSSLKSLSRKEWENEPFADPTNLIGGKIGAGIPLWRVEAATTTWVHLRSPKDAYQDWLGTWLDDYLLNQKEWNQFWFYEVDDEFVSRQRIRSRVEWLQGFRKISPGSPGDSQLSAYLLEADYLATADKVFADIIDECAASMPIKIASPVRLVGGNSGVEQLLNWFKEQSFRNPIFDAQSC